MSPDGSCCTEVTLQQEAAVASATNVVSLAILKHENCEGSRVAAMKRRRRRVGGGVTPTRGMLRVAVQPPTVPHGKAPVMESWPDRDIDATPDAAVTLANVG